MKTAPVDWLLQGDPWTEYRTRLDLLGQLPGDPDVQEARKCMISHPRIRTILESLINWPGPVVNGHKNAGLFIHLLPFMAEIGISKEDEPIPQVISKILDLASVEGPFGVKMNIPVHFGGTGTDTPAWALCDAPRIVYALAKLGLAYDEKVMRARDYLLGIGRENGFPCKVSKELGKFRGPGRKDDPCPYATLIMLEIMGSYNDFRMSAIARDSAESLLGIWENSRTSHPYMFFMGTDFRKLKAPLVWFDILHVAETLSAFPFVFRDPRFIQMLEVLESKATPEGKFIPESVWKYWSDWEFGQKKEASRWITFLVWRILKRAGIS
jgi:hypothetical protein